MISRQLRRIKYVAPIVTVVMAAAAMFNYYTERRELAKYPQIGTSVDIGGRSLNIHCIGDARPTVVFETFAHQAGWSWSAVQTETAKFSRSCWYDRAGYGWSERGPNPRTFKATALDLHSLLHAAHVPPPYVFVGSHDAVSSIRIYHGLYPEDVAAAVFVDGNDLDEYGHHLDTPESLKGPWEKVFGSWAPRMRGAFCTVLPVIQSAAIFLPRIGRTRRPTLAYGFPSDRRSELDFLSDRSYGESCDANQNEDDVRAAGPFGDRPLIVLASNFPQDSPAERNWNRRRVTEAEPRLAALSTAGRVIEINDAAALETVVAAIRSAVSEVR